MGRTNADNPDIIMISENPNSVPSGICPTMYGSMKKYSDKKSNTIDIERKIPIAKNKYLKLENTVFKTSTKSDHIIHNLFESAVWLSTLKLLLLTIRTNNDKCWSSSCTMFFCFRHIVLYSFRIFI